MLKIYLLPEDRRNFLFNLLPKLPRRVRWRTVGKPNKITKPEWAVFKGYLRSKEGIAKRKALKPTTPKQESLKNLNYQEGYLKSDHWLNLRQAVIERDRSCRVCNSTKRLNVHHRSYENLGNPEEEIKDLTLLCRGCHELFHKHRKLK